MPLGRVPYHEQTTRNKLYVTSRKNEDIFDRSLLRGCPKQLCLVKPFLLADEIKTITSIPDGLNPKCISKVAQIDGFKRVYANPFSSPYVLCIGSEPNASRASLVALHIMMRAIILLDEMKEGESKNREYPVWHTLNGAYKDDLRDGRKRNLSLLILSNVPSVSSQIKLEKLRDLLEKYHDTPRIVVTTGIDPLTFFHSYLYYHINYALFLAGNRTKIRTI